MLELRQHDPDGKAFPSSGYVFGDGIGNQVKSIKTAWENCRLKAHGFEPERDRSTARLSVECRRQLATIDLRFHDLRREAGSRFLEHGMSANYVQRFLDHANLSTTSRYLKIERQGMHAALKTFEQTRKRCNRVANARTAPRQPQSSDTRKSVQ